MMPSVVPMTPAKITAVKPTIIDTLAPKISRESTSRPTWSVPSRYLVLPPVCQQGGKDRHQGNAAEDQHRDQRKVPEPQSCRARPGAWRKSDDFGLSGHIGQTPKRMRGSITA